MLSHRRLCYCCCNGHPLLLRQVLDAGANVVLTTKGIDDMSLKYFVEAGVIACRRVPKEDLRWRHLPASFPCSPTSTHRPGRGVANAGSLCNWHLQLVIRSLSYIRRRVAKATGAQMVLTLADMDGNETFDPSALGTAEEVLQCLLLPLS